MHKESFRGMRKLIKRNIDFTTRKIVLDVGSLDICGSYRIIVPDEHLYIGLDITMGPNVTLVSPKYTFPLKENSIDFIMCGQVLEHCANPFKLVKEMHRVLKDNGLVFLVAPFIWEEHKFPIDCFRYLPNGMQSILHESGFKVLDSYLAPASSQGKNFQDCWGIGKK